MSAPFLVGLTGSIGMGKSTVAAMFADHGAAIWDADASVRRLYRAGQAGALAIAGIVPAAVGDDGVNRTVLSEEIRHDPNLLSRIEAVIHPLVAEERAQFINSATADIVVLDIPLLFETGTAARCDLIVVVSAGSEIQRERVLSRPGMTAEKLEIILSKQMPDMAKRDRADVVIATDVPLAQTRAMVQNLVTDIRAGKHAAHARNRDGYRNDRPRSDDR